VEHLKNLGQNNYLQNDSDNRANSADNFKFKFEAEKFRLCFYFIHFPSSRS
jgi:hypothetical protein